jgi:hypothetical protein
MELFFIGLAFFVSGFVFVAKGLKAYRRSRYVRDTPSSTPGAVALGRAEVQGTVRPADETIEHPIDGDPVLLFHYVWSYASGGDPNEVERRDDPDWEPFDEASLGTRFFLEDDGGRVLVDPRDATILPAYIDGDNRHLMAFEMWSQGDEAPERVQSFLNDLQTLQSQHRLHDDGEQSDASGLTRYPTLPSPNSNDDGSLLVSHCIRPGDTVYVMGRAQPLPPDVSFDEEVNAVFQASEQGMSFGGAPFLISCQTEEALRETLDQNYSRQLGFGILSVLLGPALMFGSCAM